MSSARAFGAEATLLGSLPIESLDQPLFTLAGESADDHQPRYDLALTANTVGTVAGTIVVRGEVYWL